MQLIDFVSGLESRACRLPKTCEPSIVVEYLDNGHNRAFDVTAFNLHFAKANYTWNAKQLNPQFTSAAPGKFFRVIVVEFLMSGANTYANISGVEEYYIA